MRGRPPYGQPILREIDVRALATITRARANAGEDEGLEGNQQYRDIRFIDWDFVAEAIEREQALFERFATVDDVNVEDERYRQELEEAMFPQEDFWGLDIGVISAVMALSALGVLTVSSCNAGGFGGRHTEHFPMVVMYLPRRLAPEVLAVAQAAQVGLDMTAGGLVRLYGGGDHDLHRFAKVALARHLDRQSAGGDGD